MAAACVVYRLDRFNAARFIAVLTSIWFVMLLMVCITKLSILCCVMQPACKFPNERRIIINPSGIRR